MTKSWLPYTALILISALAFIFMYVRHHRVIITTSSPPLLLKSQSLSLSHSGDIKTCFSFQTAAMPEQLIKIGAPSENTYSFPRNRPVSYNVTFNEIHKILFRRVTPTIYENWPNYFKKKKTHGYGTHVTPFIVHWVVDHITKQSKLEIKFIVEIGSFTGMSAMVMATTMKERKIKPFILCIDTWLGDMNMWINKVVYEYLSPVNGRPQVYEQFIANVIAHNLTDIILPFSTTSILGARFLHIYNFHAQAIFLDSAHEQGETLIELALFWPLVQPGGILFGDDWDWTTVRCDVKKFAYYHELKIEIIAGNVWAIKKPLH